LISYVVSARTFVSNYSILDYLVPGSANVRCVGTWKRRPVEEIELLPT